MTKQEIYEQVVQLTSELHATNVAEKIFSAAKDGDAKKVEEVFEIFKKENLDLYARIVSFGEKFNQIGIDGEIFGEEDKENSVFVFDTNTIDALSLVALTILAKIDDCYLFEWCSNASDTYLDAITEASYENLAVFLSDFSLVDWIGEDEDQYPTWYELLVAVCEGEFIVKD